MIDWGFISELEGSRLVGYVPDARTSHSGLTLASGVDINAMPQATFDTLPAILRAKLLPYRNHWGVAALTLVQLHPISITPQEASILNGVARKSSVDDLTRSYNAASSTPFDELPNAAQTVIASVHFQYGDLAVKTPHFWEHAIAQDWEGVKEELENFGDDYATRHLKEAAYLSRGLGA